MRAKREANQLGFQLFEHGTLSHNRHGLCLGSAFNFLRSKRKCAGKVTTTKFLSALTATFSQPELIWILLSVPIIGGEHFAVFHDFVLHLGGVELREQLE